MTLQTSAHPAQIKDTVTRQCSLSLLPFTASNFDVSSRRVYYRWSACPGRRSREIDHRSCHSDSYRTSERTWKAVVHPHVCIVNYTPPWSQSSGSSDSSSGGFSRWNEYLQASIKYSHRVLLMRVVCIPWPTLISHHRTVTKIRKLKIAFVLLP